MELYDRARQVAVCSDRPPDQLNDLTEMIRTLFVRGKVVNLDVPTPYHRGRILRSVCERNGWDVPESALIYLARNLTANVRTLIGVAKRVAAESTLTGKPVSPEIIDEVIAQVHSIGRPTNL
jgi:chromosomal replication initiator protein